MLVDNANIPEKGPIRDMLSWHPSAKLITEPQLGLTPARLKAIGEAAGDLFVLVDDDNVFDPDFLEQALSIMGDYPFLGSWSGQCCPEFEVPTPDWKRRYWVNLLIREFDADVWSNLPRLATTMPCGAGLCVRREVERRYLDLNKPKNSSYASMAGPIRRVRGGPTAASVALRYSQTRCQTGMGINCSAASFAQA